MYNFETAQPSTGELRSHGFPFPVGAGALAHQPKRVVRTVNALNRLAGYKFETPTLQHAHRPPTAVQTSLLTRVGHLLEEAGPCPEGLSPDAALRELMSSHNFYEGEPGNLAQYDPDKLKILRSRVQPRSLSELLPPHVLPLYRRRHAHTERSATEVAEFKSENPNNCPRQPYWDPKLRNDAEARTDFFVRLCKVGVLSFRTRIRSKVAIFFVKKKSPDAIRMIIDARITNVHHRTPTVTRLGSAVNYSDLDLSDESLAENFGKENSEIGWGSEMDVSDCFYQFQIKEMASWFGIDYPKTAAFWRGRGVSLDRIFDEEAGRYVSVKDGTVLFPVVNVMPMGWTWALFFANETVAHLVAKSDVKSSGALRERLPTPQLWDSRTISSTYMDNVAVIGARKEDVQQRVTELDKVFSEHGIPIVGSYDQPVRRLETVGCVVDFSTRALKQKPHRLWRVHLARLALARRSKVKTHVVEVWLGHATALMRMAPFLLSVFDKIYRLVRIGQCSRIPLWPSVRAEIITACHLVWLCEVDLGAGYCNQVDMGDSADCGYALMTRTTPFKMITSAMQYREKWRYMRLPDSLKEIIKNSDGMSQNNLVYDFRDLESHLRGDNHGRLADGVGLSSQYARWLQEVLEEGAWLRTSAIMSQYKAKRSSRVDVECPALVYPLDPDLVGEEHYRLLWAKRWRDPSEHINMKEARVALSSLKRSSRVQSLCGKRKLTISDNLPTILALRKGDQAGQVSTVMPCLRRHSGGIGHQVATTTR